MFVSALINSKAELTKKYSTINQQTETKSFENTNKWGSCKVLLFFFIVGKKLSKNKNKKGEKRNKKTNTKQQKIFFLQRLYNRTSLPYEHLRARCT